MSKKPKRESTKKKTIRSRKLIRRLISLRVSLTLSAILILVGFGLLGFQLFNLWRSQQTSAASQPIGNILSNSNVDSDQPHISGVPVRVIVPSVEIDLQVIPGYYSQQSNSWTLTLDRAQWATITRPANDKSGMTFIYAHYRRGVFYKLPKVKPGEAAKVVTGNGHTFTYRFRGSSVTVPQDTSILSYHGDPVLVLQTCAGIHFENRQLFVFDLVKVD